MAESANPISFRLEPHYRELLEARAKEDGLSAGACAQQLVTAALESPNEPATRDDDALADLLASVVKREVRSAMAGQLPAPVDSSQVVMAKLSEMASELDTAKFWAQVAASVDEPWRQDGTGKLDVLFKSVQSLRCDLFLAIVALLSQAGKVSVEEATAWAESTLSLKRL